MIIRIVKLGFETEEIQNFLSLFEATKEKIRHFEGCQHLQLLQDKNHPHQFFTYSHWDSEVALNNYRNSTLFKEVWAETKSKFCQKPEAWTVNNLVTVS